MRNLFILLILFLIFTKCAKENIFSASGFYGECKGKINSIDWKGKTGIFIQTKPYCKMETCVGLLFYEYDKFNALKRAIVIDFISQKTGKYLLNPPRFDSLRNTFLDTTYLITVADLIGGDVLTHLYYFPKSDSPLFP